MPTGGSPRRRGRPFRDTLPTERRALPPNRTDRPVGSRIGRRIARVAFLGLLTFPWIVLALFLSRYRDLPIADALSGGRGIAALLVFLAGLAGAVWGREAWEAIERSLFRSRRLSRSDPPTATTAVRGDDLDAVDEGGTLTVPKVRRRRTTAPPIGSGAAGARTSTRTTPDATKTVVDEESAGAARTAGDRTENRPSRADDARAKHRREDRARDDAALARECLGCGRVYSPRQQRCSVCDQLLRRAPIPFEISKRLRFEDRIGMGGMAVVYRARDLRLERAVAVKTLPRMSAAAAKRLHREARAAAAVSHPGLASIWSVESWKGMPMIVQELLDGTLADRIVAGPLTPAEVVTTGIAVAHAIGALHEAGILHRDIKPSNIGYAHTGDAKLLDFGIARVTSDLRNTSSLRHPSTRELIVATSSSSTTLAWLDTTLGNDTESAASQTDQLVGTLSYLPPEALEGESAGPSYDLWALAVVLWEALVGTNLFYGGRPDQLVQRILSADVPDIREKIAGCPPGLAAFFDRSLARELAERPADGSTFASELQAIGRDL